MKMCQPHWDSLRDAIRERGLYAHVADSGEQVVDQAMSQQEHGPTVGNFEPLMAAHMAILAHALDTAGLEIMRDNEDGSERCPLCWMNEQHDAMCKDADCPGKWFDKWIGYAADEQLAAWEKLTAEAGS